MDAIPNLTVETFARARNLDAEFLRREFQLEDVKHISQSAIRFPYVDSAGRVQHHKLRLANGSALRLPAGGPFGLYGVNRLRDAKPGDLVIVGEGESDTWAAAHHGAWMVGVSGANAWDPSFASLLRGFRVLLWAEPDGAGENLVIDVARDIPDALVTVGDRTIKDACCLHQVVGDAFRECIEFRLETAEPIRTHALELLGQRPPVVRHHRSRGIAYAPNPALARAVDVARHVSTVEVLESRGHFVSRFGSWRSTTCPFPDHEDATPSFRVNVEMGGWRCFGCHRKGKDAIAFVMQLRGLSFLDAVKELAA
jgi:CHC2-type zinc finger protein